MNVALRGAAAAILVLGLVMPVAAAPPRLTIPRVSVPPALSQYLDGAGDPPGAKVTEFVQRDPGDGVPSRVRTAAYLSYDREHLYVAFVCFDDPKEVRANLTRREGITGDDIVGVVLDPYHDGRRSYLFLSNPLGIQMDGITTEGSNDDYNFDALWHSEGKLTPDGYVVLITLPFRSLRFTPSASQTWGLALGRVSPRFNETAFWPFITRRVSSFGQQMATLEGLHEVSPGRNLQAIPYGYAAGARFLDDDGRYARDNRGRVGADAKAVLRDTVTVDLTVNPDYSQVESDEPQVTVNQRFEVFFPEKRPFFIENAGYFATPETLFFSRRVADPDLGLRVTGKASGWAFGVLGADDRAPGGVEQSRAGLGVLRLQREFAKQSYLGGFVSDRQLDGGFNRVASIDGRWRVNDTWSVSGQAARSWAADKDGATETGDAYAVTVVRETRTLDVFARYRSLSPAFRADLGFIPRVDIRDLDGEVGYDWYPKSRAVLRYGAELGGSAVWDHQARLQDWLVYGNVDVELPGQSRVAVVHRQAFERYRGLEFRPSRTRVEAGTEWLRWLAVSAGASMGEGINYYPAAGAEPFLGRTRAADVGVTVRPVPQLRIDQAYLYSALRRPAGSCGCAAGTSVFANHILRTRLGYQFTRALSLRAIVDYDAVEPAAGLVALERSRRLQTDVLFTYMVNPWTVVYAGYTDGYQNLDLAPDGAVLRNAGGPTTSVGRQGFVKVSYLLRR